VAAGQGEGIWNGHIDDLEAKGSIWFGGDGDESPADLGYPRREFGIPNDAHFRVDLACGLVADFLFAAQERKAARDWERQQCDEQREHSPFGEEHTGSASAQATRNGFPHHIPPVHPLLHLLSVKT
jgi:hypothetical protein